MKRFLEAVVVNQEKICSNIFKLVFHAPEIAADAQMGQFINIYPDRGDIILPRPISICDAHKEKGELTVMYHVTGKGTEYFSRLEKGRIIKIAGPMGNGFTYKSEKKIALVGGGIGAPPMFLTAKEILLKNPDAEIKVFLGFRNKDMVILEEDFKNLSVEINIATDDGSHGFSGNALSCLKESGFQPNLILSCGPKIMLKFLSQFAQEKNISCQVSLEERMGCGIGACFCCAAPIKKSDYDENNESFTNKKICKDGPVFDSREVIW